LLFSATMPPPIKKLADKFLSDPKTIEVARPATANVNIEQRLVMVPAPKKRDAVRHILREDGFRNAIIFCNKKVTVRELYTSLKRSGFAVGQIQGDMDQANRIAEFDRFKSGEINILVASDVAARGLDVKGVSHVINFDVPWQPDDYIHRIGRTGRAGAKGIAYTLATSADGEAIDAIERLTKMKLPRASGEQPAKAEATSAEEKPPREERAPAPKKTARKAQPKAERSAEPQEEPKAEPTREAKREPKPARREEKADKEVRELAKADDASGDWNGPVPTFLNFSAL
jgi:superfamily II DNA/RNA helicase